MPGQHKLILYQKHALHQLPVEQAEITHIDTQRLQRPLAIAFHRERNYDKKRKIMKDSLSLSLSLFLCQLSYTTKKKTKIAMTTAKWDSDTTCYKTHPASIGSVLSCSAINTKPLLMLKENGVVCCIVAEKWQRRGLMLWDFLCDLRDSGRKRELGSGTT